MTATGESETGHRSPAVIHAFAVLDAVAERPAGLRLSEIVAATSAAKSSTHRLLATMCDLGVTQKSSGGRYVLGPRLATYAERVTEHYPGLLGMFYSYAEQVRDRQDETVQLAVLAGSQVTFIGYVETTKPVRLETRIGRQLPAHASASGKAILAFREESALRTVFDAGLPRLTGSTITTEQALRDELDQARRQGYASEVEEMTSNLSCYSAPILDRSGCAVAAVTACVPTNSVSPRRAQVLIEEIRWAADELARRI